MKKLLLLVMALVCLTLPALAEDVCTLDAAEASQCVTDRSYLRIRYPLEGEKYVTLTIRDAWGYLVYQRDYGLCSGTFRSEDVYLDLYGASTDYRITLQVDGIDHILLVTRQQPRLTDTGVCAWGLPLREISGARSHRSAVLLDVLALEDTTLSTPMVSGDMQLGTLHFTVEDGEVTVSAELAATGEIVKANVFVARDAVTARTLGTNRFSGRKLKLDRAIDLQGTPYAAVLVQLTVTYDEATAFPVCGDEDFLQQQNEWWQMMQLLTANEAVG